LHNAATAAALAEGRAGGAGMETHMPVKHRARPGAALAALMACAALGPGSAAASIVINATRVVYPERESEVTVKLDNNGRSPALVQAWIDGGDLTATPDESTAPFTLTPPLFRLDPGKGQSLRLFHTREAQPQDRESLFWLNVLEVPPKAAGNDRRNALRLAFRTRIKLFFRPAALAGAARDAPGSVTWRFARGGTGYVLRAINPSAYHVTFSRIVARAGGETWSNDEGGMVDPGASADFPLGLLAAPPAGPFSVEYRYLDDFGGSQDGAYQAPPR